jgi:spore coat protein U-like protein
LAALTTACLGLALSGAFAQTTTQQFQVQITISAACQINSATNLTFPTSGVLSANVDETSTVTVQCTSGQTFNILLDAGTGAGATVDARLMTGPGGATVEYSLFRDPARTLIWGDTIGGNTQAGTGTGSPQAFTVYGRVPPQTTPGAGNYSDTITATITL